MHFLKVTLRQERHSLIRLCGALPAASMIIPLCLSGCLSTPPTAADTKSDLCPHIVGRYADKGIVMSGKGKPLGQVSLAGVLQGYVSRCDPGSTNTNIVAVVGYVNNVLEVQWWQGATQLAAMQRH